MLKEHPEVYSAKADYRIDAVTLRDQIVSPARTVLLVLLAASALVHGMVFVSRNTRDFSDTGITLLNPWDG